MIRRSTLIAASLAILAGTALYLVKHETKNLGDRLIGLNRSILENQEAVHVLKAEWSYLNQPARLEELGRRLLHLERVHANQTIALSALAKNLPVRPPIDNWFSAVSVSPGTSR